MFIVMFTRDPANLAPPVVSGSNVLFGSGNRVEKFTISLSII